VHLGENCTKYPKTFITVMAHELTHVVLYSMHHQKKNNEIYTDLAAMVLGFFKVMKFGRKTKEITDISFERKRRRTVKRTKERTTVYGYLSDENFDFAYRQIKDILNKYQKNKQQKLDEINQKQVRVAEAESLLQSFYDYRDHLNESMPERISREDAEKISKFNQTDYKSRFQKVVKEHDVNLKEFKEFLEGVNKYNEKTKEQAEKLERKTLETHKKLNYEKKSLKKEVKMLKKYSSFSFWIKQEFL
jgi:lipoate-protein ligase A